MIFWFHEFFYSIFSAGSNEHTSKSCESKLKGADAYRFAECFVCKQTGHLAKACPDNPKGLYPKGKQTHGETKIMSQKEIDLLRAFSRKFFFCAETISYKKSYNYSGSFREKNTCIGSKYFSYNLFFRI